MGASRTTPARWAGAIILGMAALAVPSHSASAAVGWQHYGAWYRGPAGFPQSYACRNYIGVTAVGSRLHVKGFYECSRRMGGSLTVNIRGVVKTKYCYVRRLTSRYCSMSFYVDNPRGRQSWVALTLSGIGPPIEPPPARVSFRY
ncbi:hypothetical protein ACBJ59_43245 [Nonomuraea sp. MTCD27]|uniref:hypothetical protein n=1 Tax=Nonomuraea sp. MTCD27 TaxID=1676747 RepID=UPI0035BF1807